MPQADAPDAFDVLVAADDVERRRAGWESDLPYVPGEVLVRFQPGLDRESGMVALHALGSEIETIDTAEGVVRVRTPSEPDAERAAAFARQQPEVVWAQPNYLRRLLLVPNDPGYTRQWHLTTISMERAWDIAGGGSERVVVAVVDSGVTARTDTTDLALWTGSAFETMAVAYRMNPDLHAERVMAGEDLVFWDGPVVDMIGHGSHVAGTILQATDNGLGLAGIAHRATLLPMKVCYGYWEVQFALGARGEPGFVRPSRAGGCPDSAIAQGIRRAADRGAHVINLSLGGPQASPALLEALEYAVSKGAFVAIAGGNEYLDGNPMAYPARYAADLAGVVAVAAVSSSGARASYSNTGSYIEVAAPGGDVGATGTAGAIYQVSVYEPDFDPDRVLRPRFDRYAETASQGTSMAAAHVSGVAALLYSSGITTPAAIEGALETSARDLGTPGRDTAFGYGLVDAAAALRGRGLGVAR